MESTLKYGAKAQIAPSMPRFDQACYSRPVARIFGGCTLKSIVRCSPARDTNVRAILTLWSSRICGAFDVAKRRGKRGSSRGKQTRKEILSKALQIAAREGLAAVTIGRLAGALGMSKSGLFAHFRSKRALELATINKAGEVFANAVLLPATSSAEGIERLWNLCDFWLRQIEQPVLPGGSFFTAAFFAYAERPGPVALEITQVAREWFHALEEAVQDARKRGEIDPDVDVKRIAFELNGVLLGAHWVHLLEDNDQAFGQARTTILIGLRGLATAKIPASAFESLKGWKSYLKERHQ